MSRWRLSLLAETDLQSIGNHIALERGNRDAAIRQLELILDKIDTLASTPLLGQTRDDLRENLRSLAPEVTLSSFIRQAVELISHEFSTGRAT